LKCSGRRATALVAAVWLLVGPALSAPGQIIQKLPMLHTYRSDEVWLQWETDSDPDGTAHVVEWGLVSVDENQTPSTATIALDGSHFVHRAVLPGLVPATGYRYRVRSGASISPEFRFRTASAAPNAPYRVAWIADNQNAAGTPFADVLAQLDLHDPDFIGHAGDTVNRGDVFADWQSQWFDPFAAVNDLGQRSPVLVARGNHDGQSSLAYAYHWLPENGSWYAQTIGRIHFVFLDSERREAEQTSWLDDELSSSAAQEADFVVVIFHRLPFTNLWDHANGYNGESWVRNNWVPLFETHQVDLVVSGHAHAYERGERNGVLYTAVGGAGGALDTFVPPQTWDFIEVALSVHHYVIMDVEPGHLEWTAYDLDGEVIDSFALGGPQPVPVGLPPLALPALLLASGLVSLAVRCPRSDAGRWRR
jgi:predicted phosphodiesterase